MWFLRRMMKGLWTAKTSNVIILRRTNETHILIKDIRKRQSHFFRHIKRKEPIEHTVMTGKISGKRDRGRLREKIFDGLAVWAGGEVNQGHDK
jgi:hypothetical protein